MRPVVLKMQMSIDGFVATDDGDVSWIHPDFDDDLTAYVVEQLERASVHVMGRATYEGMAAHWPTSDEAFAPPMNRTPKVVLSRSLRDASWGPVEIARGEPDVEIRRLAEGAGGTVLVHGGAKVAQSLTARGLIDEYQLIVHPTALGSGLALFGGRIPLSLEETHRFRTGALALVYRCVGSPSRHTP